SCSTTCGRSSRKTRHDGATAYSGAPARLQPSSRGPCDNEWAMADNDARGGTMRSTLTRVATLAGFAATALTAAAIAQAATPQVHDDAAVIARHRAAGQLGQPNVYVNEALIARHRAAGRLGQPKVSVNP